MVLIEHDVEAELVGDAVLVEITVVEVGADFRIEQAVRDRHPRILELVERGNMRIGHFREVPGSHRPVAPLLRARSNPIQEIW
jgi:hypothetical protein